MEIKSSMIAMPTIDIFTLPIFVAEVRGKSLLYTDVAEYGWAWMAVSTVLYMVFNDVAIYWIHRLEHHRSVYKYIHKVSCGFFCFGPVFRYMNLITCLLRCFAWPAADL
jgi:lathosterol oxidase